MASGSQTFTKVAQDHQSECSFKGLSRSCKASYDLTFEILQFLFYCILLVKQVTKASSD